MLLVGQTGQVGKDGDGLACFDTTDAFDNFMKAMSAGDKIGEDDILTSHAILLHRGDKVRDIDNHGFAGLGSATIRLESGDNVGTACVITQVLKADVIVNLRGP